MNLFQWSIERDIAVCIDHHWDYDAAYRLVSLLRKGRQDVSDSFAFALLKELPPQGRTESFAQLDLLGARLAIRAIVLMLETDTSVDSLRRINRGVNLVDAALIKERAIVHRDFVSSWFDQLQAYWIALNVAVQLMDKEHPHADLLGCLAERIVVAASYQIAHVESLLWILEKKNSDGYRRLKSRLPVAIEEGLEHSWSPQATSDDFRSGAIELLDVQIPNSLPQRLTTLLGRVRLSGVCELSQGTTAEFNRSLNGNKHFRYAAGVLRRGI